MRHGFVKMLICILTLFFCAEPLSVLGLEYENKDLFETDELQGTGYDINPEYADILSEEDLPEVHIPDSAQATITSSNTFDKYGDVVNYLRKCMVNRQTDISFAYKNKYDDKSFILSAVQQAYTEYTGKPKESDYLLVNYKTSNWSWSRSVQNGLYVFTVNLTASYRTTSSQESQVDSAVKNLLNSLNVYNEDDYEKIWSVYEWVTSNITYDYTSYSDTARNDQKYTPYAGLILRTCVCQGYGGLVYRLLSELGVGVRYMRGYATDADGNYVTTGEDNHHPVCSAAGIYGIYGKTERIRLSFSQL